MSTFVCRLLLLMVAIVVGSCGGAPLEISSTPVQTQPSLEAETRPDLESGETSAPSAVVPDENEDDGEPKPVVRSPEDEAAIAASFAKWRQSAPECLLPHWEKIERARQTGLDEWPAGFDFSAENDFDEEKIGALVAKAVPQPKDRALLLFSWIGSVEEAWNDSYSMVELPLRVLSTIPEKAVLGVIEKGLDGEQQKGAIRFLVSEPDAENRPSRARVDQLWKECRAYPEKGAKEACDKGFDPANDVGIALLEKYDFAAGDYAVVGSGREGGETDLTKRIGSGFYVDDPKTLAAMGKDWVTGRKAPLFACGYSYAIFVVRNGEVLDDYWVNLNHDCNTIVFGDELSYWFDPALLARFAGKLKTPRIERRKFDSLEAGRADIASIRKDPRFLMVEDFVWGEFDGEYSFDSPCQDEGPGAMRLDACVAVVERDLRTAHPNELFEVEFSGGGGGRVTVDVRCRESFHAKLATERPNGAKWRPYEPEAFIVWKPGQKR